MHSFMQRTALAEAVMLGDFEHWAGRPFKYTVALLHCYVVTLDTLLHYYTITLFYVFLFFVHIFFSRSRSDCYKVHIYTNYPAQPPHCWNNNINIKRWNSQAHRDFPGRFESSNLSRGNVSREIGLTLLHCCADTRAALRALSAVCKIIYIYIYIHTYIYISIYIYIYQLFCLPYSCGALRALSGPPSAGPGRTCRRRSAREGLFFFFRRLFRVFLLFLYVYIYIYIYIHMYLLFMCSFMFNKHISLLLLLLSLSLVYAALGFGCFACLTLPVRYGLICFLHVLWCQWSSSFATFWAAFEERMR